MSCLLLVGACLLVVVQSLLLAVTYLLLVVNNEGFDKQTDIHTDIIKDRQAARQSDLHTHFYVALGMATACMHIGSRATDCMRSRWQYHDTY